MLHDQMYIFCQEDLPSIKSIFMGKTMVWSLSSHWMLGQPSLCFCCLSVQAHQVTHNRQNWYLENWEFRHKAPKPAVEESHFPNIWVTLCSPATSGCCCVLCPSENQITSWAVASMTVAGDLSHFSVKVLRSRHRWKTWSFAVFTTGTLLSSLPNMPQQNRTMTHPLIFSFLRHRRLFQSHSPIWGFFPKTQSNNHLLCSLCWPVTGHSESNFSQPWVHSEQYLPLP